MLLSVSHSLCNSLAQVTLIHEPPDKLLHFSASLEKLSLQASPLPPHQCTAHACSFTLSLLLYSPNSTYQLLLLGQGPINPICRLVFGVPT